jgi:TPR repeat protein
MINQAVLLIKINIINNKTDDLTKAYHLLNSYLIYDKTNPEVYYYLGFLYENGFDLLRDGNIIQNPYMAFLNYKNASDLGNIKAKTKIGVARYNGINGIIPKDEETGISLIKEASNNNDQEATDYLNSLKEMGKMNY